MKTPEFGDYLRCRHAYFRINLVSAAGPLTAIHEESGKTFVLSCYTGNVFVNGMLDSYHVIEVLTDVEYLLRKLNNDLGLEFGTIKSTFASTR
jgi:hypothetical protein